MKGLALVLLLVGCSTTQHSTTATPSDPPEYHASGRTTCTATVACYEHCEASDTECTDKCDRRASPEAVHASHALFTCLVRTNCNAEPCARLECGDELQFCGFAIDVATGSLRSTP